MDREADKGVSLVSQRELNQRQQRDKLTMDVSNQLYILISHLNSAKQHYVLFPITQTDMVWFSSFIQLETLVQSNNLFNYPRRWSQLRI